jgi:membrane protein required for colicin V production
MVWIDYAIMAVLGLSCLVSLIRGFVREALSLVTWGCAFYVASHYYADLSVWFTGFEDERVRNGIAIAALFIVTLIVGAIVNYVIGQWRRPVCQVPTGYWGSASARYVGADHRRYSVLP